MKLPLHKHLERPVKTLFVGVFLVSFLSGAVGGALFGYLGSSLVTRPADFTTTTLLPPLAATNSSVADVVAKSAPAVVSIVISKDVSKIQAYSAPNIVDPFAGTPFDNDFFRQFVPAPSQPVTPRTPNPSTQKVEVGGGTGFFVTSDGFIVTNKHVVADQKADYTVLLNSGKKYAAKVVSIDPSNDLAVVKVEGIGFPVLPLSNLENLRLGDNVIAIGNALGEFRNTVSTGVVSGLARSISASGSLLGQEQLSGVIQTDAAINLGNSGGPLLNSRGEVVGINTAVAQGAQNIGFAIPSSEIRLVVDSVKKFGRIVRPFLGVRYTMLTEESAKEQKLTVTNGALLVRGDSADEPAVLLGSPADKAGLVENDIIIAVNGRPVSIDVPLASLIAANGVGDTVSLTVLHKGQKKEVKVTLVERK